MVMYVGIYVHFPQYPVLKKNPCNFKRNSIQIRGKKLKNTKAGQLTKIQLYTLIRERACPDTSSTLKTSAHRALVWFPIKGKVKHNYSLQASLHFWLVMYLKWLITLTSADVKDVKGR